jgi:hypothetical protein
MEIEYVNDDFVWKRLDCDGAMVDHVGSFVPKIGPWTDRGQLA